MKHLLAVYDVEAIVGRHLIILNGADRAEKLARASRIDIARTRAAAYCYSSCVEMHGVRAEVFDIQSAAAPECPLQIEAPLVQVCGRQMRIDCERTGIRGSAWRSRRDGSRKCQRRSVRVAGVRVNGAEWGIGAGQRVVV